MQFTSGIPNGAINFRYSSTISLKRSSEKSTRSILLTASTTCLMPSNDTRKVCRLRNDTHTCIHQNNCQVSCRAPGNHVACVLLVSRSIGNDKLTIVGREVAVCHVDGDALFALRLQAVQQKGVVNVVAGISHALAVAFQCVQLVLI